MGNNTGKEYEMPAVCWLSVTDFMHGWLEHELGGGVRCREQRVLSVQHLKGARAVLKMETWEDMMEKKAVGSAMSATRRRCMEAGLEIDPAVMERDYGVTKEGLDLFMPIECPTMCLTRSGVLRPWTREVCFGRKQALELQRLLRREFWAAVEAFDGKYAEQEGGRKYSSKEMLEEFCAETRTREEYVDAMRREWDRRRKRNSGLRK